MQNKVYLTKNKEVFLQIHDIKPFDVTYPYCEICLKKVVQKNLISNQKNWKCETCNEEYNNVNYRYKLSLEAGDGEHYMKNLTIFGPKLDVIFGTTAKQFSEYIEELQSSLDVDIKYSKLIKNAFSYCLIGRWFAFELNSQSIVNNFRIPRLVIEDYVSVYEYLKNEFHYKIQLNFSNSLESIIDTTLNQSNLQEITNEDFVSAQIKKLKVTNGLLDINSPISKNVNKFKSVLHSTPIFKRLTRR